MRFRNRGRGPLPRARRGFTLIELIVGMVLLTIGVMGLVGVSAYAMRQSTTADNQAKLAQVAQSRMERLRSSNCAAIASSTTPALNRGIYESWEVIATTANTRRVRGTFVYRSGTGTRSRTITTETTVLC